jgi:hypothetical protein
MGSWYNRDMRADWKKSTVTSILHPTHFVRGSFCYRKDLTAPDSIIGRHSDVERERAGRLLPKIVRIRTRRYGSVVDNGEC